jgi:hypothetical protein
MSDYVEWNPKRHGQRPPYWLPDMLTSVDGKNFARQPNWAWIAGTTFYVPREAVELPRIEPEPAQTDADRIEALTAEIEMLRKALEEAPIIGLRESGEEFKSRQDNWLKTKAFPALGEKR